ncbi:MAG: hypothetical protein GJ680_18555 [Alteromonadaceae bacterium]|nr:hypothetical protein [Alteromonadaceae bacterium]
MPKAIDLALQEVELREMASDFDLKRKTELIKLTVETAKLSQDYEVTNVPIPCARVETEKDSNELELVNECEDNL